MRSMESDARDRDEEIGLKLSELERARRRHRGASISSFFFIAMLMVGIFAFYFFLNRSLLLLNETRSLLYDSLQALAESDLRVDELEDIIVRIEAFNSQATWPELEVRYNRIVQINPLGALIAVAKSNSAMVYSIGKNELVGILEFDERVTSIAFVSPDEMAASFGNKVSIVSIATASFVFQLEFDGIVRSILPSPDGSTLLVLAFDESSELTFAVDLKTGALKQLSLPDIHGGLK